MQEVDISIQNNGDFSVCQVPKTDEVFVFPASLEQHRYWILDQVAAESTASNMAIAFRLEGEVNDALVEQSISELSLRHEALRTTFRMVKGELMQVISEESSYHFSVADLSSFPDKTRQSKAEDLIREHSHVKIDLAKGPLFLARLVHLDSRNHFLALTIHHSVCDGWSNGILVRDFAAYYFSLANRTSSNLAELPFQFADFTEWQKEWLDTDDARNALTFWKEQIGRNVPALDLPCDRPRTARKDGPGEIESQLLSPELNARIKAFCRSSEATMHQVLLAAFEALLSRYTGQTEFLLGSSIANRTQPGMENVVGRFANPQVILANADGNPTFRELLSRVIDWSSRAYAHQDLPFSRLMEEFQLGSTGASSQFLQVYFVYQRAFMQPQQAGESLKITPRPSVSGGVNFDMLVSVVERAEGPRVQIEYNTDLFDAQRIRTFIDLYIRVIDTITGNDALKISELPLLSAQEQSALSDAGRGEAFSPAPALSLVEAFDQHASQLGEAIAIVSGKERTSWKELQRTSLKFASTLQTMGIQRGQAVAVRLEANADAAAAVLAVLRLGAVVMPIPATTTAEEWTRILTELQPAAALASENFAPTVTSVLSFKALKKSDSKDPGVAGSSATDNAAQILSLDSHGHYRTAAVSHRVIFEQFQATAERLKIRSGSKVLIFPAETAIDAWTDLLLPLTSGAGIIYSDERDAGFLQRVLSKEQPEVAFAAPSEWLTLLLSNWRADAGLQIVCRGERLPANISQQLARAGSAWSLLSSAAVGGPVGLTRLVESRTQQWPLAPLPGQQLVVRDQWGNLTPEGVTGELWLGQIEPVRTGYLARFSSTAGFELIETPDRSVRIGGYQLHLGELEDRLLGHPDVVKAKASLQHGPDGTAELIAYIAGAKADPPNRNEVSAFLRANAPDHLSRAEIVAVQSIPCQLDGTPNLALLPRPDRTQPTHASSGDAAPPRDELEAKLLAIWEEVLGVQGIGTKTSFFTLGGYSLLIVRLFAKINKAMGRSLPITTIFNAPTIEQLADILRGRKAYSALVPVQAGGDKPPFFLVHSYLLYAGLPSSLGPDYPFYGLRELDNEEEMNIEARVTSYVKAIRSVQPQGPYYLGGWCAAGPLTVEMARQLTESGEKVALIVLFDSWRPGYAEELSSQQASRKRAAWMTRNRWKYAFHARKLRKLSTGGKAQYVWNAVMHKYRTTRDALFIKHWSTARWMSKQFGFALPHFMHNISLDTLNSVANYKGTPFSCRITLMRATDSQPIPGSDIACGWSRIATEGVEVLWAPGNHETMFKEPNLSVVGKMLSEQLEKAQQTA
ncbi:non-ribosomal peptide synthetase component F/thioesterase domain-containing protein/acyl carrier protein [Silvibacterium bohemicum]|uniref:Non-ribosomal peptide synthetase component F/thioesterase domain-containing protein/acyl carrier protein n=1 Tax=Silvibacterium bohemicum TaxID=1577686 RepID=A0A841JWH9_9BACT|nr:condensation domain-containing protein [Silvibacterium bohemicum]MBB6142798.1 non-ribosomal peptide synthetase component F/thioesterase domain-containing protein/acyl carrier protein [Silvibacterium bohemicum]